MEHNEGFAATVNKSHKDYRDWVVTAYFYSTLHYIEVYLATKNPPIHSPDHRARDDEVESEPLLAHIFDEYNDLRNDNTNRDDITGRGMN